MGNNFEDELKEDMGKALDVLRVLEAKVGGGLEEQLKGHSKEEREEIITELSRHPEYNKAMKGLKNLNIKL